MSKRLGPLALLLVVVAACGRSGAKGTPSAETAKAAAGDSAAKDTTAAGEPGEPTPQAYDKVITSGMKTKAGLFKTHFHGNKLYYEIPRSELGKDMLMVSRSAKVSPGNGYGGDEVGPELVLRWERRGHRVLLRSVSYSTVADSTTPIYRAVLNSNNPLILNVFDIEAYGPDSAPVIEVSKMFLSPSTEMARGSADASKSFLDRVLTFPTNIEVEATLTLMGGGGAPTPWGPPPGPNTAVMHWSMVKLPEVPMTPRLYDSRIGVFTVNQVDYSRPEQEARSRTYVTRYRLEKKDPTAALSEPVKPIVYYVDPNTPEWLKPWVRKGIEDWQPAFEAAGFKNGIVAKDAPSKEEDPDWTPEDARYSVIRWYPSDIPNAMGPHVHDPRSGEILEADVYMYHNVMKLLRQWYFVQVGHLDPRSHQWPFPNDLMGRLVEFVVAHEVGHTLGFQHDQIGSSMYPVDSVRSPTWVKKMGHTPSIMDYSRFNYTAQPEDKIDIEDLNPRVGPWDIYTTRWSYTPIPDAKTPDDELATLEQWSREQDSVPWYRFDVFAAGWGTYPGSHTEAVGDADAVKATRWGIKSIKQIVPLLIPATKGAGEYNDLKDMYGEVISQWNRELSHVVDVVASVDAQEKHTTQEGDRFVPIARSRQKAAVAFLHEEAFKTPKYLLPDEILRKVEASGSFDRIHAVQQGLLTDLISANRVMRLIEWESSAKSSKNLYTAPELLGDVRAGIWSELRSASVMIDPLRRDLQRSHIQHMVDLVNPPPPSGPANPFMFFFGMGSSTGDARALFRAELETLQAEIGRAIPKAANKMIRAHLADARAMIVKALKPSQN